jgi:DMSO reductase family type II enzyme chaperone
VFSNYRREAPPAIDAGPQSALAPAEAGHAADAFKMKEEAIARAFIYRWLAKAYEDPTPAGWNWLCDPGTHVSLGAALTSLNLTHVLPIRMQSGSFEPFQAAYVSAFGHAARGSCPLNEIEYGELKADPLFQPHRLADLAAFYRAFGLEVAEDAGERHDHLCLELEFMCVLAAREAYALEHQLDEEHREHGRNAQKSFLREHLGRWVPAFARHLVATTIEPSLQNLAQLTRVFIEAECVRFAATPGSEDLLLRPVDDAAESLCGSCGISCPPPGA